MLEAANLAKRFGGLQAVEKLDFKVPWGSIFGLIGPNGAGKSTVLNLVAGTLQPTKGKIVFNGTDVTRLPCHCRAAKKIARVFQRNVLFHSFSVLDNILSAFHLHSQKTVFEIFYKTARVQNREKAEYAKAMEILEFVGLAPNSAEQASNLPHGKQRILSLAIALATNPELMLLDEPLAGLNAEETEALMQIILALRDRKNITSILVEHNIKAVLGICDQVVVLNYGKKIAEGLPAKVLEQREVIEAYLGVEEDAI